jgi:large subunit ribosomal protein L10
MTREEKGQEIAALTEKFANATTFYITDASGLTVEQVNNLRRACFKAGVELQVSKNTLIRKALEANGKISPELDKALNGPTAVMFAEGGSIPARVISDFRKAAKGLEKPVLKAAWIDASVYVGDKEVEGLTKLKSKQELLGELVGLLQSPAKNVISALQSGGGKIAGILKTLENRAA